MNRTIAKQAMPPAHPQDTRHRHGFTLVEMLIVVLVIAIGSAIAMPMLGNTAPSQVKAAAQLLAADLDAARVESLSHADDPRVVVVDTATSTYHLAAQSAPATPITNAMDGGNAYSVTFGEGRARALNDVTISAVSLDGDDQLGFGVYGELDQTTAATVTLTADATSITVTINPTTGQASLGTMN